MRQYQLNFTWHYGCVWPTGKSSGSFGPSNDWNLSIRPDVSVKADRLCLQRRNPGLPLKLKGHLIIYAGHTINFAASMDKLSTFIFLPIFCNLHHFHADYYVQIDFEVTEMEPSDEKEVQTDSDFDILNVKGEPIATTDMNSLTSLSRDMQTMYEENHLSDFTLMCGSEKFYVHKCVLSARSPVFASMLRHPMNETAENSMIMPDIDAVVLDQLVSFMSSGLITELSYPMARDLYYASDKYAVLQLKDKCSEFIISSLCNSTAVEILILGDMHNDIMLKNCAISFISDNFEELNTTEAWLTLVKERSPLAVEVLSSAMTHLKSKLQNKK